MNAPWTFAHIEMSARVIVRRRPTPQLSSAFKLWSEIIKNIVNSLRRIEASGAILILVRFSYIYGGIRFKILTFSLMVRPQVVSVCSLICCSAVTCAQFLRRQTPPVCRHKFTSGRPSQICQTKWMFFNNNAPSLSVSGCWVMSYNSIRHSPT